jgi:hypothetical protein
MEAEEEYCLVDSAATNTILRKNKIFSDTAEKR